VDMRVSLLVNLINIHVKAISFAIPGLKISDVDLFGGG
jgi:hypothetical protein